MIGQFFMNYHLKPTTYDACFPAGLIAFW